MADLEHVAGVEEAEEAEEAQEAEVASDGTSAAPDSGSPKLLDRLADAPWPTTAGAAALIALSAAVPLWYTPFLAGLVLGAVFRRRRARRTAGLATLAAAAGWALPLAVRAVLGEPVLGIARVVAGLAGMPAIGALTVVATLLIAVLQGLAGVWFARAVSGLRRG